MVIICFSFSWKYGKETNFKQCINKSKIKEGTVFSSYCRRGLYLPPLLDSNKSYLKGVMNGTKRFLYCNDVSVIKQPQLKSLSIKMILNFAINNTNISEYSPEYIYDKLPNREWLWNFLNTIAGRKFKEFVQTALDKREKDILINKGLNVTAIPEIVKIFENSKNVSHSKGRTHFLMGARPIGIYKKNTMKLNVIDLMKKRRRRLNLKRRSRS